VYEIILFDKPCKGSIALLFQNADHEIAVDIQKVYRETVQRMEIHAHLNKNMKVVGKTLSGAVFKIKDLQRSCSPALAHYFSSDHTAFL